MVGLEELVEIIELLWKKMWKEVIGLVWVFNFIDGVFVAARSFFKEAFGNFDLYGIVAKEVVRRA